MDKKTEMLDVEQEQAIRLQNDIVMTRVEEIDKQMINAALDGKREAAHKLLDAILDQLAHLDDRA